MQKPIEAEVIYEEASDDHEDQDSDAIFHLEVNKDQDVESSSHFEVPEDQDSDWSDDP